MSKGQRWKNNAEFKARIAREVFFRKRKRPKLIQALLVQTKLTL